MIESDPTQGASMLITAMEAMSPQLRERLLSAILRHRSAASVLATSVVSRAIPVSYLSPTAQQSLMVAVPDQESALKNLLQKSAETDPAIVEKYRQSLADLEESEEQLTLGREVFRRECASCHRIGDLGHQVGPPLMQLNTKSPEQLLTSILEPNREVDSKYMAYVALLDDGRVLSGVIQEESASQIVLGLSGGDRVQIARTELEQLKTQGKSLMPSELHLKITTDEMRQLVVFLRANRQ
jgi:putative heme-binding domain-containing protein